MTHHDVIIFEKLKLKKNAKTNNCEKNFEIPLNLANDINITRLTTLSCSHPKHPLSLNIGVGHQYPIIVTNIKHPSPTSTSDQHIYSSTPAFGMRLRPWPLQKVFFHI